MLNSTRLKDESVTAELLLRGEVKSFSLYIYEMPLLFLREVAEQTSLAVWQISETADWFRSRLQLDEREISHIDSIRHPQRQLHWLSSRLLLRELLGNPKTYIDLVSDERGKPMVRNFQAELSISHSSALSALVLSHNQRVGVDVEKISEKVERIREKFMSAGELASLSHQKQREQLYVYWCAKESMYKWYSRKELDFRTHLSVQPFRYEAAGSVSGAIRKNGFSKELKISYEKLDDYMMAYTLAPEV